MASHPGSSTLLTAVPVHHCSHGLEAWESILYSGNVAKATKTSQPPASVSGLGRASNFRNQLGRLQSSSWRRGVQHPIRESSSLEITGLYVSGQQQRTGNYPLSRFKDLFIFIYCYFRIYGFQTWIFLRNAKADMSVKVPEAHSVRFRIWQ